MAKRSKAAVSKTAIAGSNPAWRTTHPSWTRSSMVERRPLKPMAASSSLAGSSICAPSSSRQSGWLLTSRLPVRGRRGAPSEPVAQRRERLSSKQQAASSNLAGLAIAAVAQRIERWFPKPDVVGSNPAGRTNAGIAQLAERSPRKGQVGGSTPPLGSKQAEERTSLVWP